MKKLLILLLFFASVSYSQSNRYNFNPIIYEVDTIIIPQINPFFPSINVLLYYYDLYEKECYNDSVKCYDFSEIKDTIICAQNDFFVDTNLSFYYYIKKQPTFEGFIKYLKQ